MSDSEHISDMCDEKDECPYPQHHNWSPPTKSNFVICEDCIATPQCTDACTAEPRCAVCGFPKQLRGRSYPLGMGGRCSSECSGYDQKPRSGHLWPSEWREHKAARAHWSTQPHAAQTPVLERENGS